ncbi:MAG: YfiR family protein [Rudaea sp.]|nr:YfiR family protein [Rudaea sp.]
MLLLAGSQAVVYAAALQEYQVKAVFLFNFTQFVDWPSDSAADAVNPITICVLGQDPFGTYLDEAVRGEKVDKRPLLVRRFQHTEDVEACQILFISQSESGRLDEIIRDLKHRSMLTVSDASGFGEHGGMVGFVTENNRIRLRINVQAARAAQLTISSKLLRVAEIIGDGNNQ